MTKQGERTKAAKKSSRRRLPNSVTDLPTGVQKSYFMHAGGNVIREAPLASWANFRQRALDTAIREINGKSDLNIQLESLERARHGRVSTLTFAIKAQAVANGRPSEGTKIVNSGRGKGRVE